MRRGSELKRRAEAEAAMRVRVDSMVIPIRNWCLERIRAGRPAIIGLNAPQGAGKTTLARAVCELLERQGYKAISISIDDCYLDRHQQLLLAEENPANPYLQNRGYPGTHDLALGLRILKALRSPKGIVAIPRYDKSLFGGKGGRMPEQDWNVVHLPVDLVLFEGWLVGFHALPPIESRRLPDPAFAKINELLREYELWWAELDGLIQLRPGNYQWVLDWRVEAEERMKASGRPGMTESEIREYVRTFLPAYEIYLPSVSLNHSLPTLTIDIGKDRLPENSHSL